MSDADHVGVSVSVKGRHFNQTLGSEFCSNQDGTEFSCIDCTAYNYTCTIPLSRFMPDEYLLLQFQWVLSYVYGNTHVLKSHSHDWYIWQAFVIYEYCPHCEYCVPVQTLNPCLFLTNCWYLWHKSQESPLFLYVWMFECLSYKPVVEAWFLVQCTVRDTDLSNTPVTRI